MKHLAVVLFIACHAHAETAGSFSAKEFHNDAGSRLPYRLFIPEHTEPDTRYPLVVWLHDVMGLGNDNLRQIEYTNDPGSHVWIEPDTQARHPAFVVAPQCPVGSLWVNFLSRTPSRKLWLALELIDSLKRDYPIDTDRIYVVGQSMGGFATWALLAARPDDFAAAIPVAGGGRVAKAHLFAQVPIWVFHGGRDPLVPVHEARRMVDALHKAGGEPRYSEFEHLGHSVGFWQEVFKQPDLVDWLFAQKRGSPRTGHPGGRKDQGSLVRSSVLSKNRDGT